MVSREAAATSIDHDGGVPRGEDAFRLLVDSVVDYAIIILDPTGHVATWNPGAMRVNGYLASEILGRHFSAFYPEEDIRAGKCEWELAEARREGRFEDEGWRLRKDGSRFWANVVITAMRQRDGKLVGFGKVTRDLSERRKSEDELRRSEERLRLLITSVKDYAIFMLDPTGHVATWNPGAARLKGYSAAEILGQHFSKFYPQEEIDAGKCEWELTVAARDGRFEDEGWRLCKDGSRFWANVVITPMRDEEGKLVGFAKVTRDLSERKRLEEERIAHARTDEARRLAERDQARIAAVADELREARDKAEEATRLKDDFLATVSHELRTPLNAIFGWSRMLQTGTLTAEKKVHAVDTILRNAAAQARIIDDLLDVSRIIAGKMRLEVTDLDINQIIASAIDVVRPAADAKGVAVHWEVSRDVDAVRGDAGRLHQVLWNLLTNSVKFTPRGGEVRVTVRRDDATLSIDVVDTGKGIAPGFLPRLFDRFAQQDGSMSRTTGGLGLGLAIVKHVVELHGGTVDVASGGEGKGTTFHLRLPVEPRKAQPPAPIRPSGDLTFPAELRGLRILLVDDERDANELLQIALEGGGAVVTLASSAAEAMTCIREQPPDVVVSDIAMPGEDGHTFMRALRLLPREQGGRIPAIALTAYARPEDRQKALMAGFQNYSAKPVEIQELAVLIASVAGAYS